MPVNYLKERFLKALEESVRDGSLTKSIEDAERRWNVILGAFREQEERRARKRKWRRLLCWLLGHEEDVIDISQPIIIDPDDERERVTTTRLGCLWCRKYLGEKKS